MNRLQEFLMKEIIRQHYLEQLISRERNGLIKVITGIRRCGKSYLLDPLFRTSLRESGVPDDHIIKIECAAITSMSGWSKSASATSGNAPKSISSATKAAAATTFNLRSISKRAKRSNRNPARSATSMTTSKKSSSSKT